MALRFQNLFSGSEDFDDEDFISVFEDTESSCGPTSVRLRPIPKTTTEDSVTGESYLPVQPATLKSLETLSASSAQDVDDDELLSLCSELEAEVSKHQSPATEHHLPLRQINQISQKNGKEPNNSSFQLRPSRSIQDVRDRHCLNDITAQSQQSHFNASHPINNSFHLSGEKGPCQSSGPTAKRPCLRPGVVPQPVTPVKAGTFINPSNSASPHSSMSPRASASTSIFQIGPTNSHQVQRTPLSSPRPHPPSTLQTPVVTNHLIQLMTAANKTPKNLPWETPPPKERRFPGPAGLLPQQYVTDYLMVGYMAPHHIK